MLIILLAVLHHKQNQAHAKMFWGCNIHVALKWGCDTLWSCVYKHTTYTHKHTLTHKHTHSAVTCSSWKLVVVADLWLVVWLTPSVIAGDLPRLPYLLP